MKSEKLNINIVIADRSYPLKVEEAEEAIVRKAAKMINEKMKDFKKKYDVKDTQDYLAMAALTLGIDSFKNKEQINIEKSLADKVDELDNILSDFLK